MKQSKIMQTNELLTYLCILILVSKFPRCKSQQCSIFVVVNNHANVQTVSRAAP